MKGIRVFISGNGQLKVDIYTLFKTPNNYLVSLCQNIFKSIMYMSGNILQFDS